MKINQTGGAFVIDEEKFRKRLYHLIEQSGKSQSEISRKLGFTRTRLSNILHCKSTSVVTLDVIADYFGVSVDWLLGRNDDNE